MTDTPTRVWPEPWPDVDETLTNVLGSLDQANLASAAEGTVDDLARRLDMAHRARSVLVKIIDEVEATLVDSMEDDTVLTGVGMVRRVPRKGHAKWRDSDSQSRLRDALQVAIADKIADEVSLDPLTGVVDVEKRTTVAGVGRLVAGQTLDAFGASVGNVLVTAQRRFGVWLSDYKTEPETNGYKVEIDSPLLEGLQ